MEEEIKKLMETAGLSEAEAKKVMEARKAKRVTLHEPNNPLILPQWGDQRRGSGLSDNLVVKTTRRGQEYLQAEAGPAILFNELPNPGVQETGWKWSFSTTGTLSWESVLGN